MEKSEIETIYRKYFHDVFLYIRALSENESLAEEITQETFLKAMNNIEKFDGRKDIRAWLFVIAKNTYCLLYTSSGEIPGRDCGKQCGTLRKCNLSDSQRGE